MIYEFKVGDKVKITKETFDTGADVSNYNLSLKSIGTIVGANQYSDSVEILFPEYKFRLYFGLDEIYLFEKEQKHHPLTTIFQ